MEWTTPTGYIDASGDWEYPVRAYDDNTVTKASQGWISSGDWVWGEFLELTHAEMACNKIRVWRAYDTYRGIIDVDVFDGTDWQHVYEGAPNNLDWKEIVFAEVNTTKMRYRQQGKANVGVSVAVYLYEADFGHVNNYTVSISESVGFSDSMSRSASFKQAITEKLGFVDSISRRADFKQAIADSIGLVDSTLEEFTYKVHKIFKAICSKIKGYNGF